MLLDKLLRQNLLGCKWVTQDTASSVFHCFRSWYHESISLILIHKSRVNKAGLRARHSLNVNAASGDQLCLDIMRGPPYFRPSMFWEISADVFRFWSIDECFVGDSVT